MVASLLSAVTSSSLSGAAGRFAAEEGDADVVAGVAFDAAVAAPLFTCMEAPRARAGAMTGFPGGLAAEAATGSGTTTAARLRRCAAAGARRAGARWALALRLSLPSSTLAEAAEELPVELDDVDELSLVAAQCEGSKGERDFESLGRWTGGGGGRHLSLT